MGAALAGDVLVLVGGVTKSGVLADTISTRIGADGALSEWRTGPKNPVARYHLTLSFHRGWVYAVGGAKSGASTIKAVSDVTRAPVNADGSVGDWQPATALPRERSHHSAIVHGNALYVIGGGSLEPGVYYTDILRAPILEDGDVGEWEKAGDLVENVGTQPAVEHNGYLYVVGGLRGGKDDHRVSVSSVRRAKFEDDGSLGPWQDVATLPVASGHVHDAPVVKGSLYYVNGSDDMGMPRKDVFRGTFR